MSNWLPTNPSPTVTLTHSSRIPRINLMHTVARLGNCFAPLLSATLLSFGGMFSALPVQADTVKARCDVFPKGEDRATSSGLCTFSQRQGFVSIQLNNGQRVELTPDGSKANAYLDANDKPATRELQDNGNIHIYRLAEQSIFVYWDTAPYQ
ncbi:MULTISPECIES: hypothetical protein [Aphanothece]|uniref:hypothetical protein n=1 Tax=Aphanothece TaxID=1121 RepID=UPI00398ECE4B